MDFHFFSTDISIFDELIPFSLLGGTSFILRTFLGGTSKKTPCTNPPAKASSLAHHAMSPFHFNGSRSKQYTSVEVGQTSVVKRRIEMVMKIGIEGLSGLDAHSCFQLFCRNLSLSVNQFGECQQGTLKVDSMGFSRETLLAFLHWKMSAFMPRNSMQC